MLISIIISTYNEKENIAIIVPEIINILKANLLEAEIIIIDGNSPDATADLASEMKKRNSSIKVLVLEDKKSLTYAVFKGFEIARGDILLVMDADMSHPVNLIPRLIEPIKEGKCDMAVASRYVSGGSEEGRRLSRRALSKLAAAVARMITDVKDPLSNFFALKRNVIAGINLDPAGYRIALEIIAKGRYNNIVEVPYVFRERKYGRSKFSNRGIIQCLCQLIGLFFGKLSRPKQR